MIRAAFLDRDGIINRKAREGEYITRWEDFHFLPGAAESVVLLNRAGFRVIVVTNQRCIAKGLMTVSDLEKLHQQMSDDLTRRGAKVDDIYYCPHAMDSGCKCRKPAPGMLIDAASAHSIDLRASWMIGDSDIDVEAGRNAGCKTARLLDTAQPRTDSLKRADIVASSFLDIVRHILQSERATVGSITTLPAAT